MALYKAVHNLANVISLLGGVYKRWFDRGSRFWGRGTLAGRGRIFNQCLRVIQHLRWIERLDTGFSEAASSL